MTTLVKTLLITAAAVAALAAIYGFISAKNGAKDEAGLQDAKNTENMVHELTTDEFKKNVMDYEAHPNEWVFEGKRPALIDFYATWCGPCKMTAPVVAEIAEKYSGKLDVYKVDVDKEQELAAMFGIRSIPTLLFIPLKGQPQMSVGMMDFSEMNSVVADLCKDVVVE